MKKKMGWIGFGTKDFHSYHFYVPEDWTIEKEEIKRGEILNLLMIYQILNQKILFKDGWRS